MIFEAVLIFVIYLFGVITNAVWHYEAGQEVKTSIMWGVLYPIIGILIVCEFAQDIGVKYLKKGSK